MLKILKEKTVEEAVKYFEDALTQFSNVPDPLTSEVFAEALAWRQKNVPRNQWKDYPLSDIGISLIRNEL